MLIGSTLLTCTICVDCDIVDSRGRLARRRTELRAILAQTARVVHDTAPIRSQRNSPGLVLSLAQVHVFPLWWGNCVRPLGVDSFPVTHPHLTLSSTDSVPVAEEKMQPSGAVIPEWDPQVRQNVVEIRAVLVLNCRRIVVHRTLTVPMSPDQSEASLTFRRTTKIVFVYAYVVRRLLSRSVPVWYCRRYTGTRAGVNSSVAEFPSFVTWKRWSTARRAMQLRLLPRVQGLRLPECQGVDDVWVWTSAYRSR